MRDLIRNHPIVSFISITMIWSWGFWSLLLTVIEPGELLNNPPQISFLYVVLGGIGPSLAGTILTFVIDGKRGIHRLFERLTNWRLGNWWLTVLLIPFLNSVTPTLLYLLGYSIDFSHISSLILPGLVIGLIAGCMEEVGWRGFLLPYLLKRYNPTTATIIMGLVWGGLWHGYADFFGVKNTGIYYFGILILLGPGILTVWSFVLTKIYKATNGSILMSIIIHSSISSSAFIFGQKFMTSWDEFIWTACNFVVASIGVFIFWNYFSKSNRSSISI